MVAINVAKYVAAKVILTVVHIATLLGAEVTLAGSTFAVAMVNAPHVRSGGGPGASCKT